MKLSEYKRDIFDDVIMPDGRILGYSLRGLTKIAEEQINNDDAVDSILSLGFVSKKNLGLFVSHLPELKASESALAEMLIAARLGQPGLNEGAIQSAMYSLNEAIEDLEAISVNQTILKEDKGNGKSDF